MQNINKSSSEKLELTYIQKDDWSRPVYKDQHNRLWADIELGNSYKPSLYSISDNTLEGEPDQPIKTDFIIKVPYVKNPKEFEYGMLDRLRSDCEYYLGNGNRSTRSLWAATEKEHIQKMKDLHNSFSESEKPEWLTMEQINEYERKMLSSEE